MGNNLAGLILMACGGLLFAQPTLPPPVPVVQPPPPKANTEKKVDIVPVPDDGNSAMMPAQFVKNRLEAMPAATAGYVPVQGVKVDSYQRCWIYSQQIYGKKSDRNVVLITKDDSGFHIILEEVKHQWEAGEFDGKGWLPVKTVRGSSK